MVQYPSKGIWAVGFATKDNKGEISKKTNRLLYSDNNPINLVLASCYNPTDILFYVKDESLDVEYPDDIWAIDINIIEEIIENIETCEIACGNGVLK